MEWKKKWVLCQGIIHLVRTQNFRKKLTFLTPWYAHVRVCIGGKKCNFSGKYCVRATKWMTPKNETNIESFGVGFVIKRGIVDNSYILGASLHMKENCVAFCRLCVAGIVEFYLILPLIVLFYFDCVFKFVFSLLSWKLQ